MTAGSEDATSGRVVIVTGGSRGIGRSTVERLCADGFAVLFGHSGSDEDASALEHALREAGATVTGVRVDVTDRVAPSRLFEEAERLGEVVGLVNNAGVTGRLGPFTELTDDDLRRVVDVNLVAPTRLCREAARRWTAHGPAADRSIVNISSVAARTGSPHEYVAYAASKAGLESLSVGLARELGGTGIRVNVVSPGLIDTTIHARAGEAGRLRRLAPSVPMGRPGEPSEIAAAVSWLMSPDASYVTGAVIDVAGGR